MVARDFISDKLISAPLYASQKRRKSSTTPIVVHLDKKSAGKISEESKSEISEEVTDENNSPSKQELEMRFLPFPDNWIKNQNKIDS